MTSRMMMPMIRHILIFMSFHHICFLTLLAPRLKPCAETARLSVLSCRLSRRSPRSETLLMLLRMTLTVESISCTNNSSAFVRTNRKNGRSGIRLGGQRYAGCHLCWRRQSGRRECRGRKAARTLWRGGWRCDGGLEVCGLVDDGARAEAQGSDKGIIWSEVVSGVRMQ